MRRLSILAVLWVFVSMFVFIFVVVRDYAREYGAPSIPITEWAFTSVLWGWIAQNAWFLAICFLAAGLLLALVLIAVHIYDAVKWIRRVVKYEPKPPTEMQQLIYEMRIMNQQIGTMNQNMGRLESYRLRRSSISRRIYRRWLYK